MRIHKRSFSIAAMLTGLAFALPGLAMSLASTTPAQPIPDDGRPLASPLALETWSAGSASLVPLMATDAQAIRAPSIDAPADGAGETVGKPLDAASFVRQATESGRKEVEAARNALPQLRKPELKRIAEMLVSDHGKANERLSKLAESKGWPVPGPKAAAPPPSGTAAGDFDARWTAEMIAGHERSIALYRAQAQAGEDEDLRRFARDTLPTIEHHLAELEGVKQ